MSGHSQQQGKGHSTHYDTGSGDWIELQKSRGPQLGVFLAYGKRFCETCKERKPSDKTKAYKGWKCADCKKKNGRCRKRPTSNRIGQPATRPFQAVANEEKRKEDENSTE